MTPTLSILLIDDDAALCEAIAFALETDDYLVRSYGSGEAVLGAEPKPGGECAVIDYRLPGMDGLELLAHLRARGFHSPAIMITSNPSKRLRRKIVDAGASLVEKPLLCDSLVHAIQMAVSSPGTSDL
ncbi:response regulator transcription factor [Sphingopyxis fribergensis]